jgi:hypothetical protein
MLVLAPFLVAFAVKVDSPGPVFRQERVGLRGRSFSFVKFCSMRHGNDPAAHRTTSPSYQRGASATRNDDATILLPPTTMRRASGACAHIRSTNSRSLEHPPRRDERRRLAAGARLQADAP